MFKLYFRQQFHDFLTHYFYGRCIAILGCAGRNPEVAKRSERLPTHFGSISGKHWCKIHFQQQFHNILAHCFCVRCIAILGGAGRNPEVGKHSETLPMHFGSISGKHCCKIHFRQQFHYFLTHCFYGRCIAILGRAGCNPAVGEHFERLPTHFGSISGKHCCKIHSRQHFPDFLTHYVCG